MHDSVVWAAVYSLHGVHTCFCLFCCWPESQTPPLAHTRVRARSDVSPSIGGQEVGASRSSANLLLPLFLMVGWTLEHLGRRRAGCVRGRVKMKCLGGACGCRYGWVTKMCVCPRGRSCGYKTFAGRAWSHLCSEKNLAEVRSRALQQCSRALGLERLG